MSGEPRMSSRWHMMPAAVTGGQQGGSRVRPGRELGVGCWPVASPLVDTQPCPLHTARLPHVAATPPRPPSRAPGMNTPRLSCMRDTAPMHPRLVLLAKKRPQTSVVELAANSTEASCSGACSRNRICGAVGEDREGWVVGEWAAHVTVLVECSSSCTACPVASPASNTACDATTVAPPVPAAHQQPSKLPCAAPAPPR